MKKFPLFAIPGMGVDGRIFSQLRLDRPLKILEWLPPQVGEPLSQYALRMGASLPQEPVLLLGLSLGGVVAQEMHQHFSIAGISLLSSIKGPQELPMSFRLMRTLPLYQLSRGEWRIRTLPYWAPFFGIRDPAEQNLLQDMFRRFGNEYRMWAMQQLLQWPGNPTGSRLIHLHGTRDQVFRPACIQADHWIEGGNHFMVYQRAREISEILVKQYQQWDRG